MDIPSSKSLRPSVLLLQHNKNVTGESMAQGRPVQKIEVIVGKSENLKYESAHDALLTNLDLIAELIRAGRDLIDEEKQADVKSA